jgi:hypothetical protein
MASSPSTTPDRSDGGDPCVAILERDPAAAKWLARHMGMALAGGRVICEADPQTLERELHAGPRFIALHGCDLSLGLDWLGRICPRAKLLLWASETVRPELLEAALAEPRVGSIVSWPRFRRHPWAWEVAMATQRLSGLGRTNFLLPQLFEARATSITSSPDERSKLDAVIAHVRVFAVRAGARNHIAAAICAATHELLMNAMYDAPVDDAGNPWYAHDRKQHVRLRGREIPTLHAVADARKLGLQVIDGFGGLQRERVLSSLIRGLRSRTSGGVVVDTSWGGAGLGLLQCYNAASSLIIDVIPRISTQVSLMYDLKTSVRESRNIPTSIHIGEGSTVRGAVVATSISPRGPRPLD